MNFLVENLQVILGFLGVVFASYFGYIKGKKSKTEAKIQQNESRANIELKSTKQIMEAQGQTIKNLKDLWQAVSVGLRKQQELSQEHEKINLTQNITIEKLNSKIKKLIEEGKDFLKKIEELEKKLENSEAKCKKLQEKNHKLIHKKNKYEKASL